MVNLDDGLHLTVNFVLFFELLAGNSFLLLAVYIANVVEGAIMIN